MIFRFGDFELDEARFELRRDGQPVAVQPKVLRLLLVLVAKRERAVSDDELMSTLWPTEKVSHASIKRAVLGARKVLTKQHEDAIRTVRGHGYQFVMPVQVGAVPPALQPPDTRVERPVAAADDKSFIGREHVLTALDASLTAAIEGRGGCMLLVGEPGIGKTRTLHELARRARAAGCDVWLGGCLELDGAPAFWPMIQILREATESLSPSELRTLLGPGAPDLAEVFPELRAHLPDLLSAPPIAAGPARFRLFDGFARFLVRAGERRPLLLLIDDVQRADHATLRLLIFTLTQIERARVLIVCTSRPSDHRDAGTSVLIAELSAQSATRQLELLGLHPDEMGRYVAQRTGSKASPESLMRLYEQTAGNPLFLEEILRAQPMAATLGARIFPARDAGVPGGQRRGLLAAIDRHLATLSLRCQTMLRLASVLGRDFSIGLLSQLAAQPAHQVITLLSEAIDVGVAQALPERVGHYRFTHALIRDALYERMQPVERAEQHARIGALLEAHGTVWDDARLAEVAEHFMLAAPTHDEGRALGYARRAAARAVQRLAYEEAVNHLGRALALLELGAPDPVQRMQLLLARGEALMLGAEPALARTTLLEGGALARELGEHDALVQAATVLARPREPGTADGARIALLRDALAILPASDARTPGVQALLAKSLSYENTHEERGRLALGALALCAQLTAPLQRAQALQGCFNALNEPKFLLQRLRIAEELEQLSRELGDPQVLLAATTTRFQNCVERGDAAGMTATLATLEAHAQRVRDPVVHWYIRTYQSTCALIAGHLDLAEQRAEEALQIGKVVGEELAHHDYCIQVNGIYRMRGRTLEAEAMARDIAFRYPSLPGWRATAAAIGADLGRIDLAREVLAQLVDPGLATLRLDPYLLAALCSAANLCARVGDATQAGILYDALLPYEDHHGVISFGGGTYGPVSLSLAQLATRMKETSLAVRHCEHALASSERMRSPIFVMSTCLTHAVALRRAGDAATKDRARENLRRAWEIADACKITTVAAYCRTLASQLGMSERPSIQLS